MRCVLRFLFGDSQMDQFVQMHPAAAALKENRALVRVKYDAAQALGQRIAEIKQVGYAMRNSGTRLCAKKLRTVTNPLFFQRCRSVHCESTGEPIKQSAELIGERS